MVYLLGKLAASVLLQSIKNDLKKKCAEKRRFSAEFFCYKVFKLMRIHKAIVLSLINAYRLCIFRSVIVFFVK